MRILSDPSGFERLQHQAKKAIQGRNREEQARTMAILGEMCRRALPEHGNHCIMCEIEGRKKWGSHGGVQRLRELRHFINSVHANPA